MLSSDIREFRKNVNVIAEHDQGLSLNMSDLTNDICAAITFWKHAIAIKSSDAEGRIINNYPYQVDTCDILHLF